MFKTAIELQCSTILLTSKLIFMCKTRNRNRPDDYIPITAKRFVTTNESDYDRHIFERSFSGRMTKARYKLLNRICRYYSQSPRYRCGHDYDCCGCLCGQNMSFTYKHNQVVITVSQSFNY